MKIVNRQREETVRAEDIEVGECFSFLEYGSPLYLRLSSNQDYVSSAKSPADYLYNIPALHLNSNTVTWIMGEARVYPIKAKIVIE